MANAKPIEIIRTGIPADETHWAAIADICCRTGNGGDPIPLPRWELFQRIWIEPYRRLLPQWSYVAMNQGRVAGYLTGCPATAAFMHRVFYRCRLPLVSQILGGEFSGDTYARHFARQALWLEKSVDRSFPRGIRRQLRKSFPAHLHMNVDASSRRIGVGRQLIERYISDLRDAGVTGVHLFCGFGPLPFYLRLGFRQLTLTEVRGATVFILVLQL